MLAHGAPDGTLKARREGVLATRDRLVELKLLSLDHSHRIERSHVERVRRHVTTSVSEAARAVLMHGADVGGAVDELCARLGLVKHSRAAEEGVEEEAEGLRLHLSSVNETGYTGVFPAVSGKAFEAVASEFGTKRSLGEFATAVEAAVAYARYTSERPRRRSDLVDGDDGDDDDESDDDVEDDDDDDPSAAWATRQRRLARQQATFNLAIEPALSDPDSPDGSGVFQLTVSAEHARRCAAFLRAGWRDGSLQLPGCAPEGGGGAFSSTIRGRDVPAADRPLVVDGYSAYGKVLGPHDAEQQRLNTLLMTNTRLPACRKQLPGFVEMERELSEW